MSQLTYKARADTSRIILHDSHTTPEIERGGDVARWVALARDGGLRMGLLDIGYHFIIERDGTTVETRRRHLIGTHTPGQNMDTIGVCLVGGREAGRPGEGIDNFTFRQHRSLLQLLANLRSEYGKDVEVLSHSEVQKYRNRNLPDCPPLDMEELRQDLLLYEHNGEILNAEATG